MKKIKGIIASGAAVILSAALLLAGCGSEDYSKPLEIKTSPAVSEQSTAASTSEEKPADAVADAVEEEQTAEEQTEPAEESSEESAEEPEKESAEESTEKQAEETSEESAEEQEKESAERSAEKQAEEPAEDSTEESAEESAGLLDLRGLWITENAGANHMAAAIDDEKIGVFFILEGDETPEIYWVGTYKQPESSKEPYSWISDNTYSGNGLMASGAGTMEFTYKSGKLTYEVDFQGETLEVSLVKGEWDASKILASAFDSAPESVSAKVENVLPLEVLDSRWLYKSSQYLYYYVKLYNPNEDIVVDLPGFRMTARDGAGILLGTEDQYLSAIYPQQEFVFCSMAFSSDEVPADVEIQLIDPKDYNYKRVSAVVPYEPMDVINTGIRSNKLVGEVINHNDYTIDHAVVVLIGRDSAGRVSELRSTFIEQLDPEFPAPFEILIDTNVEIAEYEVYANQWG